MFAWLLVLVVLMAGGGKGGKRKWSSTPQPVAPPAEDVGSEYNLSDESKPESLEEDWEALTTEVLSKQKGKDTAAKKGGKAKSKGKSKEKRMEKEKEKTKAKGKEKVQETRPDSEHRTYIRGRKRTGGVEIREPAAEFPPHAPEVPVDARRRSMYSSKHCIGERVVGVSNLFARVPGFQALFENGNLHAICDFPEQTGYCLELIREFYMRAGYLDESDGGPFICTTTVRGVEMTITVIHRNFGG